jgi:hypothetical protein
MVRTPWAQDVEHLNPARPEAWLMNYWTKPLRGSFFNSHGFPDLLARFSTVMILQV